MIQVERSRLFTPKEELLFVKADRFLKAETGKRVAAMSQNDRQELPSFAKLIAIDWETDLIPKENAHLPTRIPLGVSVSFVRSDSPETCLVFRYDEIEWVRYLWESLSGGYTICAHNLAFDAHVSSSTALRVFGKPVGRAVLACLLQAYSEGRAICTTMYGHLEKNASWQRGFSPSLRDYLQSKTNLELDKSGDTWRLRYSELRDTALENWPAEAVDYAAKDAFAHYILTRAIEIEALLDPSKVARTWSVNTGISLSFSLMGDYGAVTDRQSVKALEAELKSKYRAMLVELNGAGLIGTKKVSGAVLPKKNTAAIQQVVLSVAGEAGFEVPLTPTGKPSLKEDDLEALSDPRITAYVEYCKVEKVISTFLPHLKTGSKKGHVIRPNYNELVETGRSSCRAPSVQVLPRKGGERACFIPRKGRVYVGADYDMAEICTLADTLVELFGESELANRVNEGKDVHLWMASRLAGVEYGEAERLKGIGDSQIHELRQLSKALNFGFPVGMGPKKFVIYAAQYGVKISFEQAQHYRNEWLAAFPEMKVYYEFINRVVGGYGGRGTIQHPITKAVRGNVTFTEAGNFLFQGYAAVIAKHAVNKIIYESYADPSSPMFGSRWVFFIHDEIIGESVESQCHEVATRLQELMVEASTDIMKHTKLNAQPYAMRRWLKGAKTVRDSNGRIIPYE